ncbi:MAG: YodL domain-containing protein [Muribaculaceae bacterium]|nr:YodL domain-containing protein [Muribaculaceae bacterium]
MRIKIYQVNLERDKDNVGLMDMDSLQRIKGSTEINSAVYDSVFEGEVPCKTLEGIYTMFNSDHPQGYKARSLSVSDVVEIVSDEKLKPGFYFCDSFGFKEVSFEPDRSQKSERFCNLDEVETISVLLVQPGQYPKVVEIENSLEAMQRVVGGDIEEYMPFSDEVAIICNEDGKAKDFPLNRAVYNEPIEVDMTYQQMKQRFREKEKEYGEHLTGYIVFSQASFEKPYSLESRTYVVSSDNKAFQPNKGGYSIFASALDGSDNGIRLEQYMASEHGGTDGWQVERCYMLEQPREMMDIIAGDFFIAYAPIGAEKYQSLPPDLAEKYREMFKFPERFVQTENGIEAVQFKPVSNEMER